MKRKKNTLRPFVIYGIIIKLNKLKVITMKIDLPVKEALVPKTVSLFILQEKYCLK